MRGEPSRSSARRCRAMKPAKPMLDRRRCLRRDQLSRSSLEREAGAGRRTAGEKVPVVTRGHPFALPSFDPARSSSGESTPRGATLTLSAEAVSATPPAWSAKPTTGMSRISPARRPGRRPALPVHRSGSGLSGVQPDHQRVEPAVRVLDTAPTGHTLLLPDATGSYHREIIRQLGHSIHFTTPLMRLQDPANTKIIVVTLPEPTPVLEATALAHQPLPACCTAGAADCGP